MTRLEMRGLRLERAGRLFFDLDLTVLGGESLAVLGPSGCGKTSLLAVLAGLSRPTSGHAEIDGRRIESPRGLGIVLQGYGLVSLLTAAENVEVGLRTAGQDPRRVPDIALDELASVGLADYADALIETLSGGQQQRVAVARALATKPTVVVADEPTAEQDPDSRQIVMNRLFDVPRHGGVLVIATHDAKVAETCHQMVDLTPHR